MRPMCHRTFEMRWLLAPNKDSRSCAVLLPIFEMVSFPLQLWFVVRAALLWKGHQCFSDFWEVHRSLFVQTAFERAPTFQRVVSALRQAVLDVCVFVVHYSSLLFSSYSVMVRLAVLQVASAINLQDRGAPTRCCSCAVFLCKGSQSLREFWEV